MFALSRQDAEVLQETVEIDFPFTKKANYRALGACLLFTTSNKETTFDLGSSLAQTLSFLLFQFCSWINLEVERGQGHPTCPQWAAWGRWCTQHPSCPPFLINAHKGMQPAQGMKPVEGTAHCDLEISSNEHSLSLEEPFGHKGSFLVPNTALAFARVCGAGLVALQHSQRQPEPSGTHPAEFRTRFWASWAGWRHLNHSANWFDQTPPFSFSLLCAHIASQRGWVSCGEDLICLALFFLTTIFRSCWIQHFPLWLCWHPWTGALRADGLWGHRQPERGSFMLWGRKGEQSCLHSCSCGQLMFPSLERSNPPNRSVGKWAALCRAQLWASTALLPWGASAQLWASLPCHCKDETPHQQNQSIPLMRAITRREKWEKNKPGLMAFVTFWQEHKMARGPIFKGHHPAAVGPWQKAASTTCPQK